MAPGENEFDTPESILLLSYIFLGYDTSITNCYNKWSFISRHSLTLRLKAPSTRDDLDLLRTGF